jgi:hypothetical protein
MVSGSEGILQESETLTLYFVPSSKFLHSLSCERHVDDVMVTTVIHVEIQGTAKRTDCMHPRIFVATRLKR